MAADLAISLATPFVEYLITPIRRQCGYILFYRSYLRDLEEGVDKLKDELEGVQRKCEAAERNAMDIEKKVTNWIDGVNGAVMEANTLLLGEDQPGENTVIPLYHFQSWFKRRVCLDHPVSLSDQQAEQVADAIPQDVDRIRARKRSLYLNPVVCYKKGRKAKKTMLVVQELNEDKKTLGDISYEAVTTPILSAKDYESLGSRKEIVENIIRALSDEEVPAIGVWGMGGVGKSTLMKQIMRLALEKNLFQDVAMAVVSQNPDVKKIQGELAVWLGLKFKDDENISGRAARLNKRLKPTGMKKSTSEPPETMNQNTVQPEENQDGRAFQWKKSDNKSTAAPVVDHENHDQVHVGEMDKKSTKPVVEGKPDRRQKQVLIILDDIWRGLDLEEIGIPTDAGVVKLLLTSRKQHILSSEIGSQNVFMLEVLKDKEPWRLFESIVGEKLGHDSKFRSIGEEVVEKCSGLPIVLKAIATTLKNCSLQEWEDALLQFKGSKDAYSNLEISYRHLESDELKSLFLVCALINHAYVPVNDLLYYGMGLGLLKGTNTVRSARDKLKALLHGLQDSSLLLKDDDQDLDYVKIHDVVHEVAIRIAYRDHYSHLITDEFELKEITQEKLNKSKAISIPYVNFRRLPEGWECPELRMFILYRRVDDPPIGIPDSFFEGMKELRVLDFTEHRFDSLPSSIQFLLNLNTLCLDLCSIKDLTIIGKLKQLQILTFRGSEIARLPKEIGELSELKVLNLERSKLEVIEPQVLGRLTSLEELHLEGSSFIHWEDEGEVQPSNAKVSELNNLSNLSMVKIHIHNPSTIPIHLEFGNLVEYIIQIGDVWDWTGDYKELRMLKIKLDLCRVSFLHEEWVQDLLKRTQSLHLDGIKGWQRSIHELCLDGFQELKHLHIQNNSLVQCVARSISNWLPCTAFIVLESLFLEKLSGLEMISRGPIAANSFSKLKVIKVIGCGKLKNLFSYSMLKGISQLEDIEVRDCEAMQEIVTVDSVATNTEAVKLQALHRINLHNLPKIKRFCSSHIVEVNPAEVMPTSSEIVQEDPCLHTSTMFSNDQLISFPLLKSLILSSLPKLKYIWQNDCSVDQVANLEYLEVSSCDDLLIVIPSSLVKEVMNLETLMVRDCGSVQEVFETSDGVELNLASNVEILSRMNKLELFNLPFLRHIWENNQQAEKVSVFQNLNSLVVVNCSSLVYLFPAALLKSLNQLTDILIESCKEMKAVIPPENDGKGGETKNIVFRSLVDVWLEDLPNMVTFVWTQGSEAIEFPSIKELNVKECPKMRSFSLLKEDESARELCFFHDMVLLPKLAILDLISVGSIQKIWHEEIREQSFGQLEKLNVVDCQNLVDVIPSINMTTGMGRFQFHNLKEIKISNCTSLERPLFGVAVDESGNEYNKGYYSISQLEILWLWDLPKLKHVVQPNSRVVVGFPSLVEIQVSGCLSVTHLFPIAIAATFSKLKGIYIVKCSSMRQIFGKDEIVEEEDEMLDSLLFPCLHSLIVQNLDSLISLFLGYSSMLGFPSLKVIKICGCPKLKTFIQSQMGLEPSSPITKEGVHNLFDDKVELPNLKNLELYDLSALHTVWRTKLPCLSICDRIAQITTITVKNCENLEEFICESDNGENEIKTTNDPAVVHSLANVRLENLPNMVAFVRARRDRSITFPSLKELWVESCPKMIAFYLSNKEESDDESRPLCFFDHKVLLPQLVALCFLFNGSMEKIWHEEIPRNSFCQIEELIVRDCVNLVNIFPSNVMGGERGFQFQNLKIIITRGCTSLEGSLFYFAGEEKKRKGCKKGYRSLPKLESLFLTHLPNLEYVVEPHAGVYSFPNLVEVEMGDNPSVIDLFPLSTAPTLSKLQRLVITRCGSMRQVFGKDKAKEMEEMTTDPILFPCLRSILLQNLDNLISLFPVTSSVLHFPSLEALDVSWCEKLKTFVQRYTTDEFEESAAFLNEGVYYLFDDKVELPNLKKVELYDLNTLQTIWKTKLPCIGVCDRIAQLTEITVRKCENLEELFIFESDHNGELEIKTTDESVVFNSLTNVMLENLPNMVAFIRGRRDQSINFPSLKKLQVAICRKMRAFCLSDTEESGGESLPLCFFDYKVLVPKLEELDLLSLGSIEKIWHEEMFEESIFQLEMLVIAGCQNLVNVFPSKYVTRSQRLWFQNLKTITVRDCSSLEGSLFEFVWEGGEEKGKKGFSLPRLEKLCLFSLPKLEHVIHPTLDVLVEFQSLVDISIENCHCLIDLFPSATATILSKLEKVQIVACRSMRYAFGKEAAEDVMLLDSISFPCLRTIRVRNLDNLICFFLGTIRQLDFPSLEDLEISWCPVLKTFFQRHINENVHYLFDAKVEFPNLQNIKLFQVNSLQTIWMKAMFPSSDSCSRLRSLIVLECKELQNIFPASFVSKLAQLEELCIRSSGALEEIVMYGDNDDGSSEELDGINSYQMFFFPQLMSVELSDLPNLRSFFRGCNASTWSALKKLGILHCHKVQTFTSKFSSSNSENSSTRQSLFSAEQVIPKLEKLNLVKEDLIMIQEGEFEQDIFTELKIFSLSCFHNERAAAFPSRFMLENNFQKLERFMVFDSSFEEIFADESLSPQEIISYKERFSFSSEGNRKPLARLTEVKLSKLHNLKHV